MNGTRHGFPPRNCTIDNPPDNMSENRFCQIFHGNLSLVAASSTSSSRVETVVMQLRQGVFEGRFPRVRRFGS
jgi:hypothetical protein